MAQLKDAEEKYKQREKTTAVCSAKELSLIKSEKDALRLAKEGLEKQHKALQENAAATEKGYTQICAEKVDLELEIKALRDDLRDVVSERDSLRNDLDQARSALEKARSDLVGQPNRTAPPGTTTDLEQRGPAEAACRELGTRRGIE